MHIFDQGAQKETSALSDLAKKLRSSSSLSKKVILSTPSLFQCLLSAWTTDKCSKKRTAFLFFMFLKIKVYFLKRRYCRRASRCFILVLLQLQRAFSNMKYFYLLLPFTFGEFCEDCDYDYNPDYEDPIIGTRFSFEKITQITFKSNFLLQSSVSLPFSEGSDFFVKQ